MGSEFWVTAKRLRPELTTHHSSPVRQTFPKDGAPMPNLKKISREAIARATQKAERYRLLNQSWATESICLDILEVDPTNQPVLVMLILAITDQFGPESGRQAHRARAGL